MDTKRKIAITVNKLNLKEVELADDRYWSDKSAEDRLKALIDIRQMAFGYVEDFSIKKIIYKRRLHEEVET
ncbi:hypothetical protein BH20BAC1_BH20BAC1_13850 [soil metagenome]